MINKGERSKKLKKLVLYNPHVGTIFSDTVFGRIFRKTHSPGGKYFHMIKYSLENQGKLIIYLSKKASSFPKQLGHLIPHGLEIYLWCKFNNIDYKKVQIIGKKNLKNMGGDFVLWGLLRNVVDSDIGILKETKAITCFNLTHLTVADSKRMSNYINKINPNYLVSESNLFKNSAFFRKYFPDYKKDVLVMNFVPQKRFKVIKPFSKRKNKCVATGTLIEYPVSLMNEQFYEFYKINTYHPTRKMIYYGSDILSGYVDSYITRQTEKEKPRKKFDKIVEFIKKTLKIIFVKTKKEYFSFNIVGLYNSYQMCVVGEETELPGVGFVEGMSCGCAYIGQDLPFYRDIGMIPGKHFIAYGGTAKDLKNKIEYYQNRPKKLKKIAEEGRELIEKKCNYNYIIENFLRQL